MAYNASVIPIMIASPGDVLEERNEIRDILHEWNDIHSMRSHLVLLPVGWDTHSTPDLGGRPQELINNQILDKCDLLVGVFWTRIGTPTGEAESGTVEEIQKHIESGKPAMVYFSTAPVAPQSLDQEQYNRLVGFKNWCKTKGLIEQYDNLSEFSDKFRRQIQFTIRDNDYIKSLSIYADEIQNEKVSGSEQFIESFGKIALSLTRSDLDLSEEAKRLLIEASNDRSGTIMSLRHLAGQSIQTNSINFVDSGDRRSVARWEAALEQLIQHKLIIPRGHKNEIFELTAKGFEVADAMKVDL